VLVICHTALTHQRIDRGGKMQVLLDGRKQKTSVNYKTDHL
jgi:hypothetical protein